MRKIAILMVAAVVSGFGMSSAQLNKIQIAYDIGKKIKASDGTTFEHTLPSIMGTESSWGKMTRGDKYFKDGKLKPRRLMSLGNYQIKISTAKETIRKYSHLTAKYSYLLDVKNLQTLMDKLEHNSRFGAEIAGHYLLSMYEQSLKKRLWNPYMKAVGRYNGGWNNMDYADKIIVSMQTLKQLKKERKINA